MKTIDEDSWNRFPEARVRMREDGLKTLLEGLGEDGFCLGSTPRIQYVDDGVYVEILFNAGKHGSIVALPLEVFIPAKLPASPKKKLAKVKKTNEVKTVGPVDTSPGVPTVAVVPTVLVDELRDSASPTGGPAPELNEVPEL